MKINKMSAILEESDQGLTKLSDIEDLLRVVYDRLFDLRNPYDGGDGGRNKEHVQAIRDILDDINTALNTIKV